MPKKLITKEIKDDEKLGCVLPPDNSYVNMTPLELLDKDIAYLRFLNKAMKTVKFSNKIRAELRKRK